MGGAKVEAHELIANLRQTSALHLALTTLHTVFAEFLDIQIVMFPPYICHWQENLGRDSD